jgi:hypothetical protein
MNTKSILVVLLVVSMMLSCKKKQEEDEVVPLQNLRIKKDARYYYHYDSEGRIVAQDLSINDVVTRYWDYYYNRAGKIEKRVQLAKEYSSDELKNQYFFYDANNRLEKVVKKRQNTGSEYRTDSICLHYDNTGVLSYSINYQGSYIDSAVYSNFYQVVARLTMIYRKQNGFTTYALNSKVEKEYDQYSNLIKTTVESVDPNNLSKRETVNTYEPFSDQTSLVLTNTNGKSHYFSFEMSPWVNSDYTASNHFQKSKTLTDYTRNCTEQFDYKLEYDANGFIQVGTSKGVSSCYQGNNFNESYDYKAYIIYESL